MVSHLFLVPPRQLSILEGLIANRSLCAFQSILAVDKHMSKYALLFFFLVYTSDSTLFVVSFILLLPFSHDGAQVRLPLNMSELHIDYFELK